MEIIKSNKTHLQAENESYQENVSVERIARSLLKMPNLESIIKGQVQGKKLRVQIQKDRIIIRKSIGSISPEIRRILQYVCLHKWKNIVRFRLEPKRITNEDLKTLGSGTAKNLKNLRSLTLDFTACHQLTDTGITGFVTQVARHLSNLRCLVLIFDRCQYLTNKGIEFLCAGIAGYLWKLQDLTLDFSSCSEITDDGTKFISFKILRHLTNLKALTLSFDNCFAITDKSIETLTSEIIRRRCLTNIERLTLSFACCLEITDQGLRMLGSVIAAKLMHLKQLTLDFEDCPKVYQSKREIYQSLSFIPNFRIL